MFVGEDFPANLVLRKQLVVDVCEPFLRVVEVKCRNNVFKVFKFGSFEFDSDEYIYGTEESEYNSSFSDATKKVLPVVLARREKDSYVLSPIGSFRQKDLDMINDNITYTLESQSTMSHYMVARC
ncbi:MAG: hypothetical protein IKR04_01220 [Clostridia bacterium]|nr:hypothetical protein [Clostridia bacterium]